MLRNFEPNEKSPDSLTSPDDITKIQTTEAFEFKALELFHQQLERNTVYRTYVELLRRPLAKIQGVSEIPCLPVEVFKTHDVFDDACAPKLTFTSSSTTGQTPSRHLVADPQLYERAYMEGFRRVYGDPSKYRILALLPGYLERSGSSLIHMVEGLINATKDAQSGFYLYDHNALESALLSLPTGRMGLLIGVTHALLDFSEQYTFDLPNLIVMETGGMKGRREELVRKEVHSRLKKAFGVNQVHSEYGMTELLSQAYSSSDGRFFAPPWMKVLIREVDDPFALAAPGKTGRVNVIDLANRDSCAFIATGDLGRMNEDGSFEILGRFDQAEVRGCNLMVST